MNVINNLYNIGHFWVPFVSYWLTLKNFESTQFHTLYLVCDVHRKENGHVVIFDKAKVHYPCKYAVGWMQY
jgi:hypothetical protein